VIAGMLLDYSRKLSRVDSSAEKLVRRAGFLASLFSRGSYTDDYERINRLLAQSGKKIVVTIDDLDRLYSDEVIEVLRLIRNTANFSNIFYLVAYERSYIQQSIKAMNTQAGSSYLDKIIQLEIPLPKRDTDDLLLLLERLLTDLVAAEHLIAFKENIIKNGFKNRFDFSYAGVFRQSRDVIKFINNFKITYKLLGTETMFENLFVLELIKFRFPLIYDRLFERHTDFVQLNNTRSLHNEFYEVKTYKSEKETLPVIARALREEKQYDEKEIALISGLINNLFFKFSQVKRAKNSIRYPMFFERYFRYRLTGSDLSETSFRQAFEGGLATMREFIAECEARNMLLSLSTRLFQMKADSRATYELKIGALMAIGSIYDRGKSGYSFDVQALIDEMWDLESRRLKKYYANDTTAYKAFVSSQFEQAAYPFLFHNLLIYTVKKGSQEIGLSKDELTAFSVRYFERYLQQSGFTKEAMYLAWWTRREYTVPVPDKPGYVFPKWEFAAQLAPVLRKTIAEHDPFWFLKYSIQNDFPNNDRNTIYEGVLQFFANPGELRQLVADHGLLDAAVKTEYLAFFDACASKGFDQFTEFVFWTDLKPARNDFEEFD